MIKSYHYKAVLFMSISIIILLFTIYGVKKFGEKTKISSKIGVVDFNLSKIKRAIKKRDVKQIKKKKNLVRKKMKALRPSLDSSLTGKSFGLDGYNVESINLDEDLLVSDEDVIMDENSVDTVPKVIYRAPIEFPENAIKNNITNGVVKVRMLVNKDGSVTNIEILSSKPQGYFDSLTLSMIKEWKFRPATYKDRNVSIWVKQVVRFGS